MQFQDQVGGKVLSGHVTGNKFHVSDVCNLQGRLWKLVEASFESLATSGLTATTYTVGFTGTFFVTSFVDI